MPTLITAHPLRCTEHDSPLYVPEVPGDGARVACSMGCVFPAVELGPVADVFVTDAAGHLYIPPSSIKDRTYVKAAG